MEQLSRLTTFLEKVCARPRPDHPMARVRTLAKELAEGAVEGLWDVSIQAFRGGVTDENAVAYLLQRWDGSPPHLNLLISSEYAIWENNGLELKKAAFDLLDEAEPANIFISYRRKDSSAFALLVLARLKTAGLEPFVDLALVPGENWEDGLKQRIQKYDYFIALIGQETLRSAVVIQEMRWALEAGLIMIPIWHNGFVYQSKEWPGLEPEVDELLSKSHTIRVLEESALGYNNAIVELLNRFGITP